MVIEHADFDGIERLAKALKGEIISTFSAPERKNEVMGECQEISEIYVAENKMIKFSGLKGGSTATIVIRGSS